MTGTGRRSPLLAIVRSCSGRRPRRDEDGASLVEFAIILPVFALMLFGMIQFGLAFTAWDQLRNAVQASAREVALDGTLCSSPSMTASQCETAIENSIGTPVGTTGPPTVALYYNSVSTDGPVVAFVSASAQVQSFTGYFGNLTLSSTSEFSIQQTSNASLQNPAVNCPAPLSTLEVPSSAACNVNSQGGFYPGATCLSFTWLDGYYIWDPPPDSLTSTAASWMQMSLRRGRCRSWLRTNFGRRCLPRWDIAELPGGRALDVHTVRRWRVHPDNHQRLWYPQLPEPERCAC